MRCDLCHRVGGCGCLWESPTRCKACAAKERGEELPMDIQMEFETMPKRKIDPKALQNMAKQAGKPAPEPAVFLSTEDPSVSVIEKRKPLFLYYGCSGFKSYMSETAESLGMRFFWQGHANEIPKVANDIKCASMVAIWNGLQHNGPLAARLCRRRGIPHFFFEWGMLPQKRNFFVDARGFCGDSILNDSLAWVTDADRAALYARRSELQALYPRRDEGFVLVPLQLENDAQVLYHSPYNNMREFVAQVEAMYPNHEIIVRPHPLTSAEAKTRKYARAVTKSEGEFLEQASRAAVVVGITSTTLYEAGVLGVPVVAMGDHPLRTHPTHRHDDVLAGALALCVRRNTSMLPVLERLGVRPLFTGRT